MQALPPPSLAEIWGFFFLLLGPIKIIAPFVRLTEGSDDAFRRRLAVRAFLFSTAIVLLAATLGVQVLRNLAIPPVVLALTGGLILFLVALQGLMEQFTLRPRPSGVPAEGLGAAATPLAFPVIVTPSGVAAVIIFMALAADLTGKGQILLLLLAVMGLDLLAMLFARPVLRYLGMPLMVMGTVLSVVQVALGLNIMLGTLDRLGVIALARA